MQDLINSTIDSLKSNAFARIHGETLFSSEDLQYLHQACESVPKELIRIGDVGEENNLDVGRFMEDRKEETPAYRNSPLGQGVVDRLNNGRCKQLLRSVMEGDFYIRRCQANLLGHGSFIGKHIDTYSNLDYLYSCVLQFGNEYEGGEFFVDHNGQEQEIRTGYGDFLINRCEIPHGVRRVTAGKRMSLVFFLSKSPLTSPNTHHKQV